MAGTDEVHALAEAVLQAADVAGLGVMVSYDDGGESLRLIYVSEGAAQILGYAADELAGSTMPVVFAPEERERLAALSTRWRKGDSIDSAFEAVGLRKNGERVAMGVALSVVALAGEPAVVAFVRDIRERKAAEARIASADRMATLGMLAAGVAHEINNPLGYVALCVERLARHLPPLEGEASRDAAAALASAREGLARAGTIVRDLLSLSAANTEVRWPVDVQSVLESAVNVAMHAIRGRACLVRRYRDVPALKTDPARLGQVLLNLLFNAVQSFDDGDEARNEICLEIASAGPGEVAIRIGDNGCGIEPRDVARIFEPFFTTKVSGTGLGLAICQSLVSSLGGRLEVRSARGVGSTFIVRLPAPWTR